MLTKLCTKKIYWQGTTIQVVPVRLFLEKELFTKLRTVIIAVFMIHKCFRRLIPLRSKSINGI
jgi:hypothetical protein